jgi:hypothetical protein
MENQIKADLIKNLKTRIPYNENIHANVGNYENILNSLLNDSLNIGLSLKYPFDDTKTSLPARYNNWQIRCCLELYKLAGNENIKSYKENGLEWTLFRDGLSINLIHEIIPRVGIPKPVAKEDEDV